MELIHPIFKWLHVVAGIMWIGLLYFFNFVNTAFAPTMDADTRKRLSQNSCLGRYIFLEWVRPGLGVLV